MRELCLVALLSLSLSLSASLSVSPAAGAALLFPKPLHIVRRLEDPLAKRVTTVDEYCAGNRVVSVNGDKVVITDYDKQQITEIDRARATYSITSFADVAAAQPRAARTQSQQSTAAAPAWKKTPLGMKSSEGGRSVDTVALESGDRRIDVGVDRQVALSREAVEVLVGAAYPVRRSEEHEQLLAAARGAHPSRINAQANDAQLAEYGLPSETVFTLTTAGGKQRFRNSVLRVTAETVPDDLLRIAPGSTLVESPLTRTARELQELDAAPPTTPRP